MIVLYLSNQAHQMHKHQPRFFKDLKHAHISSFFLFLHLAFFFETGSVIVGRGEKKMGRKKM